jgi:hypothetical protein
MSSWRLARRFRPGWRCADSGVDLVSQEQPAPAELVGGNHASPRELQHRGMRKVQQLGDGTPIEDFWIGELRHWRYATGQISKSNLLSDGECQRDTMMGSL